MAQAPGFQMEAYDVGGSHTGTQTGYQAFGFGDQHRTLLEGINVTEGTAWNAGYFDYGSLEDFQLGGAGNMSETHGLGAFLNLTTKSGGDRFTGDVHVDFLNDRTVADNVPDALRAGRGAVGPYRAPPGGLLAGNPVTLQSDVNVGLGGPLRPGRTWFYAGYRLNHQEELTIGNPHPATTQLENWTAKVTHQLGGASQLVGFFNRRTKLQAERGLGGDRPLDAAWYQQSANTPMKLEYRNRVSNRLFLNLQVSHWINRWPLYPTQTRSSSVEGISAGRLELTTGDYTNAYDYYHFRSITKPQASGNATFFADDFGGEHTLKVGFEVYRERLSFLRMQPGDLFYRDLGGAPAEVDIYNTPNTGVNTVHLLSGFAQDSWAVTDRPHAERRCALRPLRHGLARAVHLPDLLGHLGAAARRGAQRPDLGQRRAAGRGRVRPDRRGTLGGEAVRGALLLEPEHHHRGRREPRWSGGGPVRVPRPERETASWIRGRAAGSPTRRSSEDGSAPWAEPERSPWIRTSPARTVTRSPPTSNSRLRTACRSAARTCTRMPATSTASST